MYETRAYDNEHGDPVAILVATGGHDVSRLVNLLAGSRTALCEHMGLSEQLLRQIKRHNGGRAALHLLAAHGGPDLLETADQQAAALESVREYAGRIARSENTAYAKAGRELLSMINSGGSADTGNQQADLWCDPCCKTHPFTAAEVERIVYALQADAVSYADEAETYRRDDLECLREALRGSHSPELYAEHVAALVERREITEDGTQ